MATPSFPLSKLQIKLIVAGKMLFHLPSATPDLLQVLSDIEQILSGVQQEPPKSINNAMPPIIEAMIAKELLKHPDMDVNISVASCICEILRIMAPKSPYNDEQMKDFFEMVVITFEKLSSVSGGCFTKMTKVLKLFSDVRVAVLMLDFDEVFDRLVIRLFKQFLTAADSNSSAVVHEMEKIMTMILEEAEDLTHELRGLIVTSVKKDNQIASPVCLQLGKKVLKNCAAQLKSQLLDMGEDMSIARYDYSKVVERICKNILKKSHHGVCYSSVKFFSCLIFVFQEPDDKLNDTTLKINGCLETVRSCQQKKKNLIYDDPLLPSKVVTDVKEKRKRNNTLLKKPAQFAVHGENLSGSRIKVWCPEDKADYEGVVKSFNNRKKKHKVSYDDGDEECISLNKNKWEFVENVFSKSDCPIKCVLPRNVLSSQSGITCVQGYNVKKGTEPILKYIFKKHGDIAAECVLKTASARSCFLEIICEIVRRIQANDVNDGMEEIERQVSDAEAANINVSWLSAHLEVINKRKEAIKKSTFPAEMKTTRYKTAVKNGGNVVKSTRHSIKRKVNNSILDSKAEKDSKVTAILLC